MTTTPVCELSAGKLHNENPPNAVIEIILEWDTRDGERMRRLKKLCEPCYLDKAEETREHAGLGKHSILIVQTVYIPLKTLPPKGRTIGRTTDYASRNLRTARKDTL